MYIDAGVPIYPSSLGHSYHTLIWRMGIESKEIASEQTRNENGISTQQNGESRTETELPPVDRFYTERSDFRSRERYNSTHTYLEEKSMHKLT